MNMWRPPSQEPSGRGRRGTAITAAVVVAVVLIGGGAAALTLQSDPHGQPNPSALTSSAPSSSTASADGASLAKIADAATPGATASEAAPANATTKSATGATRIATSSGATTSSGAANPSGTITSTSTVGSASSSSPSGSTSASYPALTTVTNLPAYAGIGTPYYGTVTVSGGKAPYIWEGVSGLPSGLTVTPEGATLVISGTVIGGYSDMPAGYVHDSESPAQVAGWQVKLSVGQPIITVIDSGPDQATVGQPFSATYTATGGPGTPFTWSNVQVPSWLKATVNGATVTVSGTPTQNDVPASVTPETGLAKIQLNVSAGSASALRVVDIVIIPAS